MAAVVSAAASAKQQQTGSGVPEGKAKEMDPPVKEADAPVFQGLLDSIGALNDSLKKPTSSTKSDDSQAVPGIFYFFKIIFLWEVPLKLPIFILRYYVLL